MCRDVPRNPVASDSKPIADLNSYRSLRTKPACSNREPIWERRVASSIPTLSHLSRHQRAPSVKHREHPQAIFASLGSNYVIR